MVGLRSFDKAHGQGRDEAECLEVGEPGVVDAPSGPSVLTQSQGHCGSKAHGRCHHVGGSQKIPTWRPV